MPDPLLTLTDLAADADRAREVVDFAAAAEMERLFGRDEHAIRLLINGWTRTERRLSFAAGCIVGAAAVVLASLLATAFWRL